MNANAQFKDKGNPPAARKKAGSSSPVVIRKRRVLIVDDHPMTREGLSSVINREADFEISAVAGKPAEAMAALARGLPDLMLTDMTMPGRGGLEFIKDILALHPRLPILVSSMHDEAVYAERVLRAGARGYIMKEAGTAELLAAIRRVLGGKVWLSEAMSARMLANLSVRNAGGSGSPIERLSDREFEVFQLIGLGLNSREIALKLGVSPKTVDAHRGRIKEKLALLDATALLRHAVRWMETGTAKTE
jgi:DNA-binding NarL/FixJ family response regulator